MSEFKIGWLGMGAIGFPMCYVLSKEYPINLPTYRREIDQAAGFSPVAQDAAEKATRIDEMVAAGCTACADQKELIANSNIIMISMPKSAHVEMLMNGPEGIIENAKPGTIVIDLTSADAASTRALAKRLEEKNVDIIDACVSGGVAGASKGTLTIMCGGKEEIFNKVLPILNVIGKPENIRFCGPSGAGDTIKAANNFLSALVYVATAEALCVCEKAGIDPMLACDIFSTSGGMNHATVNKFPAKAFKGKNHNFAISLMTKDVNLFNNAARSFGTTAAIGNLTYEIYNARMQQVGPNADMLEVIKLYEEINHVNLIGIDKSDAAPKLDQ